MLSAVECLSLCCLLSGGGGQQTLKNMKIATYRLNRCIIMGSKVVEMFSEVLKIEGFCKGAELPWCESVSNETTLVLR